MLETISMCMLETVTGMRIKAKGLGPTSASCSKTNKARPYSPRPKQI